jgi:hypothetical protein
MKERQRVSINRYLATGKVMAGINCYSVFIISLITYIVTAILFVKILLMDDEEKADFFLIYNIFSIEKSI